jgi:hypothetical protein
MLSEEGKLKKNSNCKFLKKAHLSNILFSFIDICDNGLLLNLCGDGKFTGIFITETVCTCVFSYIWNKSGKLKI